MSGLYCDVLAPPGTQGAYGEIIGNYQLYIRNQPCDNEHLSGREGEVARATFGASVSKIKIEGADPRKPLTKDMRLVIKGGIRERTVDIADLNDVHKNGTQYELICGESDG